MWINGIQQATPYSPSAGQSLYLNGTLQVSAGRLLTSRVAYSELTDVTDSHTTALQPTTTKRPAQQVKSTTSPS
jgi:hypothetical protein